ncbi:MAG: AbrB/MazE/SpoVT family DNA-binding domain-containing protein [Acidobacteriaceae bacterium]
MPSSSPGPIKTVEATVTSKGQVTLPSELRKRLGLQKGSRVRFSMSASGAVKVEPVRYSIKDLWKMADKGGKPDGVMSFAEMNAAKARG